MRLFRVPPAFGVLRRRIVDGLRARGVRPRIARRVGDNVGDRHAQRVVDLVGHLIARHELSAGRVSRDHDCFHVREDRFVRELSQDLVDEVERRELGMTGGVAARSPAVAAAAPVDLVPREDITAAASVV